MLTGPSLKHIELCAGIQELQEKRLEVAKQVKSEEAERHQLQQDLAVLTNRLSHIDASLRRKVRLIAALTMLSSSWTLEASPMPCCRAAADPH